MEKKHEVMKVSKRVLRTLLKTSFGRHLLEMIPGKSPTWRLIADPQTRKKIRRYRKDFESFVKQIEGEHYQHELPFDE